MAWQRTPGSSHKTGTSCTSSTPRCAQFKIPCHVYIYIYMHICMCICICICTYINTEYGSSPLLPWGRLIMQLWRCHGHVQLHAWIAPARKRACAPTGARAPAPLSGWWLEGRQPRPPGASPRRSPLTPRRPPPAGRAAGVSVAQVARQQDPPPGQGVCVVPRVVRRPGRGEQRGRRGKHRRGCSGRG